MQLGLPLLEGPGCFPVENETPQGQRIYGGDKVGGSEGAEEPLRSIAGKSASTVEEIE